jgi:hypothetical protein
MQATVNGAAGEWHTIQTAAHALAVSVDTIKRRIRRGELPARQEPTTSGYRWLVYVSAAPAAPADGDPSASPAAPAAPADLAPLAATIEHLATQNAQLAARCGYLEAELAQARQQLQALTAPASRPPWWRRWWR